MNISFIVDKTKKAKQTYSDITKATALNIVEPQLADVIVVLGGDGFMLRSLHQYQPLNKPVYGVNCGTVGFLMNKPPKNIINAIKDATITTLNPLKMHSFTHKGEFILHAINEVSLLRQTHSTAKLNIFINDIERMHCFIGDGLIISTPAGSTAYNFSANGPILPLGCNLLALTPINAFKPKRWRGAILQHNAKIVIEIIDHKLRAVSATADNQTISHIKRIEISQDLSIGYSLLFEKSQNLAERILKEQFIQ